MKMIKTIAWLGEIPQIIISILICGLSYLILPFCWSTFNSADGLTLIFSLIPVIFLGLISLAGALISIWLFLSACINRRKWWVCLLSFLLVLGYGGAVIYAMY